MQQQRFCVSGLLFSVLAGGQVLPVGSADGTVRDSSGALLPKTAVQLMSQETGAARTTTTNDLGYYLFTLVPPGRYQVTAERPGFKKAARDIVVETGRRVTADFTLELGAITETVEVLGRAALLETSTAAVSRNIERRQIQDLPLLGRNPLKLMLLAPGVTANATTASSLLDVSGTSYVSANGSNRRLNEFLLDGIPNNISDRVNYIPPVDVVEEFTIQTNALDAEYGHNAGAFINITSRSGSNQLHGQLYEFLRNDKLNANSFFNNKFGVAKTAFRYNQFGAAAGGPIVRNKAFWYFNWEGVRQRTPSTWLRTTPTDPERRGDFSQSFDRNGNLMEIHDPFSTRSEAGRYVRDAFPGNRIPASRFDPISRNVINRFPAANRPGDPFTHANNFYSVLANKDDSDSYSVRVDPNFNRHRVFARWSFNKRVSRNPTPYDIGGLEGNDRGQSSVGLSDTFTLNPTTILTAQAGFSRWTQIGVHPAFDLIGLGFPAALVSQMQQSIFPSISVTDAMAIGTSEGNWFEHTNTYSFQSGLVKIAGRHNLKAGFQTQIKQNNSVPARYPSGNYSFNRGFTQGPDPNRVASNSGNGVASLLLGTAGGGTLDLRAYNATQAPYYGWYIQEDFKLTSKLTVNLGLRYEITLGTTERYDRNVFGFDRTGPNPIEAAAKAAYAKNPIPELAPADFRVPGGLLFVTKDKRRNAIADKDNWAPRIGAAYRLLAGTVLRAGFGVFYSFWWQPFVRQDGFSSETAMVTSLDGGRTPADLFRNPFPQGLVQPVGASLGMQTLLGQSVQFYDQNRKAIRTHRWNFGLQQEIGPSTMIEITYVGQAGRDLPLSTSTGDDVRNLNFYAERFLALGARLQDSVPNPFVGLISTGALSRPTIPRSQLLMAYPQFSAVNIQRMSEGRSSYHSLQASANRRMAGGLQLQLAYTWSKLLEELRFINAFDPAPSKMIGEFDNPHRFTASFIYELPFGKGRRFAAGPGLGWVLGGWDVSGIYIYQTGAAVWLPGVLHTGISPKLDRPTIDQWFNREAMKILPPFTARRNPWMWNDLRTPNQNNWDVAVLKNATLGRERIGVQLRAEFINAFNHPWFGSPDVNPASANYGKILSQANSPREIQLALKLRF